MSYTSHVANWSVADVIKFLHNIGITHYDSSFSLNHINGSTLLLLTPHELKHDLGITSLGHRKQIIEHVEKLQNENNGSEKLNEYANEYAMTACISAAVSSILTQYYKSKKKQINDENNINDHISDMNNRNSIVRVAVCMATEAARYIIHNQERIMNIINTHPMNNNNDNNILDTLTNCRKLFAFNGNDAHLNNHATQTNEAKRSNRAWSDCDERELIKLKSLGTLTWNRIGECLQRTGAACQLHWKTMKNSKCIKTHIENINNNNNNTNNSNNCIEDHDTDLIIEIDKVLKANQWNLHMLDALWQNVEKEMGQKKDIIVDNNSVNNKNIKEKKRKKKHIKTETNTNTNANANGYLMQHQNTMNLNGSTTNTLQALIENGEQDNNHRSSRSNARWIADEEEVLIKMLAQNNSLPEIAKKLGRSIPAINQHRLAMKHKNAKSLNDSSDEEMKEMKEMNRNFDAQFSDDGDEEEDDDDDDEEEDEDDDDININQQNKSTVVLTPIITPNSYVSSNQNSLHLMQIPPQFNNSMYSTDVANMSNGTTVTTSSASANSTNTNENNNHTGNNINPFKSMPVFNVHKKRSLSPPYFNNNSNIAPPNKKARLSATEHLLPLITSTSSENIVLPSLNTSFQTT